MLNITILAFGKLKNKAIDSLVTDYLQRLAPYARIKVEVLTAEKFNEHNHRQAQAIEAERLVSWLAKRPDASVVLLDETGRLLDSHQFTEMVYGETRSLIFVIGSSLGFASDLKSAFPYHLSLSPLTMPHELARLVLIEQLYRSTTIEMGKTYHY